MCSRRAEGGSDESRLKAIDVLGLSRTTSLQAHLETSLLHCTPRHLGLLSSDHSTFASGGHGRSPAKYSTIGTTFDVTVQVEIDRTGDTLFNNNSTAIAASCLSHRRPQRPRLAPEFDRQRMYRTLARVQTSNFDECRTRDTRQIACALGQARVLPRIMSERGSFGQGNQVHTSSRTRLTLSR